MGIRFFHATMSATLFLAVGLAGCGSNAPKADGATDRAMSSGGASGTGGGSGGAGTGGATGGAGATGSGGTTAAPGGAGGNATGGNGGRGGDTASSGGRGGTGGNGNNGGRGGAAGGSGGSATGGSGGSATGGSGGSASGGRGTAGAGGTQACGRNTCRTGETCCNASCGICAPTGGGCIQIACVDAGVVGDAAACLAVPEQDAQCSGQTPHYYRCLLTELPLPCVIRTIGDATATFCCP